MSILSFMLFPEGYERCMIRRHFLECFLGTAPKGLTVKVEKGGDRNGPAVRPAVRSFVMYSLMMWRWDIADWRLGACLVMCEPVENPK